MRRALGFPGSALRLLPNRSAAWRRVASAWRVPGAPARSVARWPPHQSWVLRRPFATQPQEQDEREAKQQPDGANDSNVSDQGTPHSVSDATATRNTDDDTAGGGQSDAPTSHDQNTGEQGPGGTGPDKRGDNEDEDGSDDEVQAGSLASTVACLAPNLDRDVTDETTRVCVGFTASKLKQWKWWKVFMLHNYMPAIDPSFSAEGFIEGAKAVFPVVHDAVLRQDEAALNRMCTKPLWTAVVSHVRGSKRPVYDLPTCTDAGILAVSMLPEHENRHPRDNAYRVVVSVRFQVEEHHKDVAPGERFVHVWQFQSSNSFAPHQMPGLFETFFESPEDRTAARDHNDVPGVRQVTQEDVELEWELSSFTFPHYSAAPEDTDTRDEADASTDTDDDNVEEEGDSTDGNRS